MKILVIGEASSDLVAALNAIDVPEGFEIVSLNTELSGDGEVPTEIELIPPGETLVGRDGRVFVNDDPVAVVNALKARGIDLVIDFEHGQELRAPNGEAAPAAGWGSDFWCKPDRSVWAKVSWTPRGHDAIKNREYRYLSPVLLCNRETMCIRSLASVGLVNKPNLFNKALNREHNNSAREELLMLKKLLAKLGLPENATEEQALNALGKLQGDLQTALNQMQTPSLDKFVPRADYDQVLTRATNAEQTLADQQKADLEAAINAEVDAALKAGKIVPATKDFYVAMCRQGGLEEFRKFVAAAPVIGDPSALDSQDPNKGVKSLNAEEQSIAEMFGNTADDLKKYA